MALLDEAIETTTEETIASVEDLRLVEALRAGDEAAFEALINRYHASLVRLATIYVGSQAVAEDVAQETWLGVLRGLDRFEGRSSLKTWIFRILTNRAKTRGQREGRSVPFSAFWNPESEPVEAAVDIARFGPDGRHDEPVHWITPPQSWGESPEERLMASETLARIRAAIELLPPTQREVITLRDIEGWTPEEVCSALGVSDANQRVLLHRARSKVRRALEEYFESARA